jgi:hypothetical protein
LSRTSSSSSRLSRSSGTSDNSSYSLGRSSRSYTYGASSRNSSTSQDPCAISRFSSACRSLEKDKPMLPDGEHVDQCAIDLTSYVA